MLTYEQNVRAIIECCFSESREELHGIAVKRILELYDDRRRNEVGEWVLEPTKCGLNGERVWKCANCGTLTVCYGNYCHNCGSYNVGDKK